MKKALIAMSGGVDSSVTAYIMKQRGYDCIGITFRMFDKSNPLFRFKNADNDKDINDAKAICDKLEIPFIAADASEEFEKYVINNFVKTYEKGGTPNPCVECNRHIKFSLLNKYADEYDCDVIVTGHYADIGFDNGRYYITRAEDEKKDQSYVLYPLTQEQLKKVCFPLASVTKEEARKIAEDNGFINARKSDSQDICFIPDGDYAGFICRKTKKTYPKGKFINTAGERLGLHNGIIHYTIGQRKGLGIALGFPAYVKCKNIKNNTVTLATNDELFEKEIIVENFNFMAAASFPEPVKCSVKIRYSHNFAQATAEQINDTTVRLIFDEAQRAPSDGQSAVLYDGNKVLGGGIINTKEKCK